MDCISYIWNKKLKIYFSLKSVSVNTSFSLNYKLLFQSYAYMKLIKS